MKVYLSLLILILVTGCVSIPEEPKGEFVYIEIEGFFKELNKNEIEFNKKQSQLTCENEALKISIPTRSYTPRGDSIIDAFRAGYQSAQAEAEYAKAISNRNKFYDNCMELKGWKKIWIPYETDNSSEETK